MYRAAVIGCGPRGCEHAHALTQLADVTLAGICDREPAVVVETPSLRSSRSILKKISVGHLPRQRVSLSEVLFCAVQHSCPQ